MKTMSFSLGERNRRAECAAFGATLILTLAATFSILRLWGAHLTVPLAYKHDSMPILMWTKTLVDNGWWLTNPYLGAPMQLEMHDYPTNCTLHFAVLKCLALLSSNAAVLVNLYFLLSFPLVALAALTALRSLDVTRGVAVVGSILFAFLPYHFWRGESHLFLATYYLIPLVCMVIIWLAKGEPFLIARRQETGRLRLDLKSGRAVSSLLICAAIGCDFPYYPVFAIFFLTIAGIHAFARSRSACALLRTAVLVGVTAASFLGNMSPSFLYWWKNGPNLSPQHVAKRPWTDGESLGLTVTQLLLPSANHRLPLFRALHDKFYGATRLASEDDAMALGAAGSLGLLLAIGALLCCQRSPSERGQLYHLLGVLIAFAIFGCTAGGFGTGFNLLGLGILRCYNRISIFIAFLALAALCAWLDALYRRYCQHGAARFCAHVALGLLLLLGLADQTAKTYVAPFAAVKDEYQSDADFVARIEASVPDQSMIFQLPYVAFLSYANSYHQMLPYSHFRGYLHSHRLRWSFGAMHGRFGDSLHARVAALPIEDGVRDLAFLGFNGIFLDRFGYGDSGKEMENKLRTILRTEPIVSRNGRLCFFGMTDFSTRLKKNYSPEQWQKHHDLAYYAPVVEWGSGFYQEESAGPNRWRWCARKGELRIFNPSDHQQSRALRFVAKTCLAGPATLSINSTLISERLPVNEAGAKFDRVVDVPPGRHVIHFDCTATPFVDPTRTIVFGLYNFQFEEVDRTGDADHLAKR